MSTKSETHVTFDGLIGGREKREVVISEYDDQWPEIFQRHERVIGEALGDIAVHIEHIGSTSVPGLAAKPIIDILVVVPDPGEESSYLPALAVAGYELRVREPEFDEHRMVRTPERDVHVHIFPPHSKEIDRYMAFRNQLRTNSVDRIRYGQAKRMLAERVWEDMNEYADAKSEVIEEIISKGLCSFNEHG
ncbi:MAG: GrpB family protein [Candidatus Thiodiazotropha sp.]